VNNGTEYAAALRGDAAYPAAWGRPPGARYSEERAAWVRECVRKHAPDPVAAAYQQMAARDHRMTLWLRLHELKTRQP
jgi:hypothetical protein